MRSTAQPSGPESPSARPRGGAVTRERILDAAAGLFYAHGIRGTSADRIIELAGISKVTFYRHFPTKSDLVVAYIVQQASREQAMMTNASADRDPMTALNSIASTIGEGVCLPGFRGCAFINAAAEHPDADDPVRVEVDRHRRWTRELFAGIAAGAGVADPEAISAQLMMVRDGAMVGGYLGAGSTVAADLSAALSAVVRAG